MSKTRYRTTGEIKYERRTKCTQDRYRQIEQDFENRYGVRTNSDRSS